MEENTALMKEIINKNNDFNAAFIEIKNSEINLLNNITNITTPLRQKYEGNIGNGSIFENMNCKFINSNVQVILYYLKNAFKNDIYEVGVYLIIAAFAMPFAISFTILLVVLANEEIEKNKENLIKKQSKRKSVELKLNNDLNKNDVIKNESRGDVTEGRKLKALFVDGGPRKNNNTAQMLQSAMKGASEAGAEVTMIRLYEHHYTGCVSCFACKLKDATTDGVCAIKDDLRPVLELARQADIIVIGSPVYFGFPTGETRSFMERLLYPNFTYERSPTGGLKLPINPKRTAVIYTMNCPEMMLEKVNFLPTLTACCNNLRMVFGHNEMLLACNTLQFNDYSRYAAGFINGDMKRMYHDTHFPVDLKNAYDLGKRLVEMDDTKK